jgi:hypothetical protein
MNDDSLSASLALNTAEEVLRVIFGDDLHGCTTTPAAIAPVIAKALAEREATTQELLGLYQQLVESLHRISAPPEGPVDIKPDELRMLLSERLDGVHELTARMMNATELLRKGQQ